MPLTTSPDPWPLPELQRARRAIVVVDVVESVRLMQEDESGFIDRWRRFVNQVRTEVLPAHGGRLVKSLGDGMLLEFASVPPAVAAALALQQTIAPFNVGLDAAAVLFLRIGIHDAEVVLDDIDIYGAGVNLAARLAALASVGQVVVSAAVRDQMVEGVDASVSDLGPCYLKHIAEPVRAFRLDAPHVPVVAQPPAELALVPTLAVLPFATECDTNCTLRVGTVLADDLIATLARQRGWRVVSPLTMSAFEARRLDIATVARLTHAHYVVSGSVLHVAERLKLTVHLTEVRTESVVWSTSLTAQTSDLFVSGGGVSALLAGQLALAILKRELTVSRAAALPSLHGYTLLLHAIALMHRFSQRENDQSRSALEHLIERHPRAPDAHAWMAKWHFMHLPQVQSLNRQADVAQARAELARALDHAPGHALALALDAHLTAYLEGALTDALDQIDRALIDNPNEALAWLFRSNALARLDRGSEAVAAIERAAALSPLDPLSYFFDTFAAAAHTAAGTHQQALAHAQRSVRANATHLPGLVQLIVAEANAGQMDAARASAARYLSLRPTASVQRFIDHHPAQARASALRDAQALLAAGIPH